MNTREEFTKLTALSKLIDKLLEPLREELQDELRKKVEGNEEDRLPLMLDGQRVGYLSAHISEPKQQPCLYINNAHEFISWAQTSETAKDALASYISSDKGRYLRDYLATALIEVGELPEGAELVVEEYDAQFMYASVTGFKLDKAVRALPSEIKALGGEISEV